MKLSGNRRVYMSQREVSPEHCCFQYVGSSHRSSRSRQLPRAALFVGTKQTQAHHFHGDTSIWFIFFRSPWEPTGARQSGIDSQTRVDGAHRAFSGSTAQNAPCLLYIHTTALQYILLYRLGLTLCVCWKQMAVVSGRDCRWKG